MVVGGRQRSFRPVNSTPAPTGALELGLDTFDYVGDRRGAAQHDTMRVCAITPGLIGVKAARRMSSID